MTVRDVPWDFGGQWMAGEWLASEDGVRRVWEVASQVLVFKGFAEIRFTLDCFRFPRGFTLVCGIQQHCLVTAYSL